MNFTVNCPSAWQNEFLDCLRKTAAVAEFGFKLASVASTPSSIVLNYCQISDEYKPGLLSAGLLESVIRELECAILEKAKENIGMATSPVAAAAKITGGKRKRAEITSDPADFMGEEVVHSAAAEAVVMRKLPLSLLFSPLGSTLTESGSASAMTMPSEPAAAVRGVSAASSTLTTMGLNARPIRLNGEQAGIFNANSLAAASPDFPLPASAGIKPFRRLVFMKPVVFQPIDSALASDNSANIVKPVAVKALAHGVASSAVRGFEAVARPSLGK